MKKQTYNVRISEPESKESEIKYPILMKVFNSVECDGEIILMSSLEAGTVIHGIFHKNGYYSDYWDNEYLKPFDGELILSNKTI